MKKLYVMLITIIVVLPLVGCSTAYKAQPLSFKSPAALGNMVQAGGAQIGGQKDLKRQLSRKSPPLVCRQASPAIKLKSSSVKGYIHDRFE